MSTKNIGYSLVGIGLVGIIISLVIDILGFGKSGIQAAQLLGILLGIIFVAAGVGFVYTPQDEKVDFRENFIRQFERLCNLPTIVWIVIGFLVAYVLLFIFPVLFNLDHRFQYLYRYLPDKFPVGLDLNTIAESLRVWLTSDQGPYQTADIFYPPLHHVLLAPILLLNYPQSYYLVVGVTLISLFVLSFLIPVLLNDQKFFSIPLFFLFTALFSYGFQFELERGQFNVITFTLCILLTVR
jgi:hypothetical protein